jgi:hypothetical protein
MCKSSKVSSDVSTASKIISIFVLQGKTKGTFMGLRASISMWKCSKVSSDASTVSKIISISVLQAVAELRRKFWVGQTKQEHKK